MLEVAALLFFVWICVELMIFRTAARPDENEDFKREVLAFHRGLPDVEQVIEVRLLRVADRRFVGEVELKLVGNAGPVVKTVVLTRESSGEWKWS